MVGKYKRLTPNPLIIRNDSRLTEKTWGLLIDALSNSMDLHSEDEFVEWVTDQTNLTEESVRSIHRSYWLLDPLGRNAYGDAEWTDWISVTLFPTN